MKVLLSWLREFAPFEGEPAALGDAMSRLGMSCEEIVPVGQGLDGVVVARVLDLRPHPKADRIQLVDVDAGDGEALQICCGAFNMAVGDLVPLATLGTVMPGGLEIARRKLRGEWSNGMLCSSDELGLGAGAADGILVLDDLDPAAGPGTPVRDALGLVADTLFDLEINPNRPDALSVAGVARDLAASLGLPFSLPSPAPERGPARAADAAAVEIVDRDLCGRFVASVIEGVAVGRSPRWLANRLVACGMRPINSVVDVSNYVMLELGQPNHTYDLDRLADGRLRVRWARDGERIVTLDGVERTLDRHDGVIADGADVAVGIAGVMGGASTEIGDATTRVLLEMAWWAPMAIARSSKRLGLRSEASARFERGTDPAAAELATARFVELLAHTSAPRLAEGQVEASGDLPDRSPVVVRVPRVNALLGTALDATEIRRCLEPIGFGVEGTGPDLAVTVPTFRPDTTTETDVVEEVARHHGYDRIPTRMPTGARAGGLTAHQRDRRAVREVLAGAGVSEAMPMPFLAPDDLERAGLEPHAVTITNPLVAEESVIRTSLRPGLLRAVALNEHHRNAGVWLFEVGRTFARPLDGAVLPHETEHVAAALAGAEAPEAVHLWRTLAGALGLTSVRMIGDGALAGLHPTRSARLEGPDGLVGAVGEIDPDVATRFGITQRVAWFEADLGRLLACRDHERRYRRVSRYPSSDLDLAFVVPDTVAPHEVSDALAVTVPDLVRSVELFDVFRGGQLGDAHRSLAFRVRLQADDRTLTDDELAAARAALVAAVESATGAALR